jgi:pimeloyl-ACP methyl ester carboxylesterase
MVGLLDALGAEEAVIADHDWGAPVAWHAGLLRPDRFRGAIGFSVPFRPRGAVCPTTVMPQTDDAVFYQLYFQTPGVAEVEFEHDVWGSSAPASIRSPGTCRTVSPPPSWCRVKVAYSRDGERSS